MKSQSEIIDLWLQYNRFANNLSAALGRTKNIVGEYAEHLAFLHYGGELCEISGASADIKSPDGKLYQVKARKVKKPTTQLSVIRSWKFDFLVVILFNPSGGIMRAVEVPVNVAESYGVHNSHQNGWVITTTQRFLNDEMAKDISEPLLSLNQESK